MKTIDKELLFPVFLIQNPSRNRERNDIAISEIIRLAPEGCTVIRYRGNLLMRKGPADGIHPFFLAHMDQVHDYQPLMSLRIDAGVLSARDGNDHQFGVGRDDKCGIYVAVRMLHVLSHVTAVFVRDEEVGCLGSKENPLDWFDQAAFVIQADRNNRTMDIITFTNGATCASPEFADAMLRLPRIQPGGGASLAESRRKVGDLRKKLTTALDQLAVKDSAEAAEIVTSRQALEQRISITESKLQALGTREFPEALAAATAALTSATAEVDRRRAALSSGQAPQLPEVLDDARIWQAKTRDALQNEEQREQSLIADADARRKAHAEKLRALQSQHESLESGRKHLDGLESSARVLEQNHGDLTTRTAAIEAAAIAENTARATLDTTNAALAELNPDLLQQNATRLSRVIGQLEENQREAQTRIAVARSTLALDGSSDPEAELLQAKARHVAAMEARAREKRHADAIALLHRLFAESQNAISESVTQPIADRVAGYLECVFGRGVRVRVDLTDPAKASLQLTRPGAPAFSFDSLSGGAKEQVAAAVRLATAEILAANHDGTLPILFDDAFAYADDERIQALQSMPDLAATRGLQVLVLSCTPADYLSLGAREIRLTPRLWTSSRSNIPPAEASNDSSASTQSSAPAPPSGDAETAFLDTLRAQGGSAGNLTLRAHLGWDEASYEQVKTSLVARNLITPGKGRGGSVSLP